MRVRYFIKKEDGIVVCIGENTALDVAKELQLINSKNFDTEDLIEVIPFLISDSYKGVARLSSEDVWDEEVGKKIAYAKMMTKYLKAKSKVLGDLSKETYENYLWLTELCEGFNNQISSFDKELKQLF